MTVNIYSGTATLSATLGAGGVTPSATVTCTLTDTDSVLLKQKSMASDINGPIAIAASLTTSGNSGTFTVQADRQIPAGKEIVFDWVVLNGTTA